MKKPWGIFLCQLREHRVFIRVLLLGFGMGLVYTFLAPPWQHYDEPTHFEYAWLTANHPDLLATGKVDLEMRREVAASMIEHQFFIGLKLDPDLFSIRQPAWIGISQTGDPPLYYWIAGLPLRLARYTDITLQLYLARLVSLCFLLLTLVSAYGAMAEIVPPGHPLRWAVPAAIGLLAGFLDLMTAVNNDVGATAFFTLFLWISLRIWRKGFSFPRAVALLAAAAACWFTKTTVSIVALMVPVALIASIPWRRWRLVGWAALALAGVVVLLEMFAWGDAAYWTRLSPQRIPTRLAAAEELPEGQAIQLEAVPGSPLPQVIQVIPGSVTRSLRGAGVTFGAWIWADHPVQAYLPYLTGSGQPANAPVVLAESPVFYTFTTTVPQNAALLSLVLAPFQGEPAQPCRVFYKDIILVKGMHGPFSTPEVLDASGSRVAWDGLPLQNLVRNPSGRLAWPMIRPAFDEWVSRHFPGRPAVILSILLDWRATAWYYKAALSNLFYTFWGKFGWGHIPLIGFHPYRFLAIPTCLGLAGFLLACWRRRKRLPWEGMLLLGVPVILLWGAAFARGAPSLYGQVFIPGARYAYPAILPTMLLLVAGWRELFLAAGRKVKLPSWIEGVSFGLFFATINILAFASLVTYFSR